MGFDDGHVGRARAPDRRGRRRVRRHDHVVDGGQTVVVHSGAITANARVLRSTLIGRSAVEHTSTAGSAVSAKAVHGDHEGD